MLAGNTLTWDVSPITPTVAGGFISLDPKSLIQANAHDFVIADGAFARNLDVTPSDGLLLFDGIDYRLEADASIELTPTPRVDPIVAVAEQVLAEPTEFAEIAILNPTIPVTNEAPLTYFQPSSQPLDLDPQLPQVEVSLPAPVETPVSIETPTADSALAGDTLKDVHFEDNPTEAPADEPFPDAPGLAGKTAKLEVIDDVIQLVSADERASTRDAAEGGAIQVFAAIASTQRAYETQLSETVAGKLDDNEPLPTSPTPARRPVLAELARAVAFETVSYRTGAANPSSAQPTGSESDALQTVPAELETERPDADSLSTADNTSEDSSQRSLATQLDAGTDVIASENIEPKRRPTERIDDEADSTVTSVFTRWTALISVVASYLLIERRPRSAETTVQTPPRRRRGTSPR